ncbi:MAG TPA: saccharopine dehydrogenase C-terminal domain-containing protein [Chitinophagaceae bacterium]|nr:saccharopine dehydrogenase C-terminal domain-containing protein [Chitinophagaceae bacterium]
MKTILIFGAGKSATSLIEYLCNISSENDLRIIVCDTNLQLAQSKIGECDRAVAMSADVSNSEERRDLIGQADLVISMLPPSLHALVAEDCLHFRNHLLTASYIDKRIKELDKDILGSGLLFLCEMGLDPGIDHMSAMKMIHKIKKEGGNIVSFRSHCGGLIAPESDDNPWHYKFTWNPSNVVMAGISGAVFKSGGTATTLPYEAIFENNERVDIPGLFPLAWYANRDSMSYIDTYQLQDAATFIRTTLRHPSFCRGWHVFVKMGLTNADDYAQIENCTTYREWFQLKKNIAQFQFRSKQDESEFDGQVSFLGLNNEDIITTGIKNSASILQSILEKKLAMKPHDKDMIVMLHEIQYRLHSEMKEIRSCLVAKGEDEIHTAMAKTVGLPLGIAAKLILQEKIRLKGLHIPTVPEIYEPVLRELEKNGIKFHEY